MYAKIGVRIFEIATLLPEVPVVDSVQAIGDAVTRSL
jgi:hypothetical protein